MKRRKASVSVVRLLREQQDIYEQLLREARQEVREMRVIHNSILTRLQTLDLKYPDLSDIAEDLRYLHSFCDQFWSRDGSQPLPESGIPVPKSATEILPNVPAEKRSKFWQFVERLMALIGKDRRA